MDDQQTTPFPRRSERREAERYGPAAIRVEDTEPYLGLQYVARLFKIAAVVVLVALVAEVIAGLVLQGIEALFPLFSEVIRGVVLMAILWGVGDLTLLLIDIGHDVRASRVLLGRLSARLGSGGEAPRGPAPGSPTPPRPGGESVGA